MHRGSQVQALLVAMVAILFLVAPGGAHADDPVVRAVLFYSPSCGHCHKVITEDFPPLFEKYGDKLQVVGVNTADAGGSVLFDAAGELCGIPPENSGVPLLVVGVECLVGSADIPEKFPGLIEQYLAAGGIDWPQIPGLREALAPARTPEPTAAGAAAEASPPPDPGPTGAAPSASPTTMADAMAAAAETSAQGTPAAPSGIALVGDVSSEGVVARFNRDPIGNGLSVIVLVGMIAAMGWAIARRPWRAITERSSASRSLDYRPAAGPADWAVPLLSLIGLGVAGYLAYVETQQVQAICGPVGDCNTVQQSEYARLFGLLPIGVVGVLGYLAILAAWLISRFSSGSIGRWARFAMWAMIVIGVLFSIYLTFLEPFVIGATCAWCLSSAVIMTLLLLLTTTLLTGADAPARLGEAEVGRQAS